MNKLNLAAIALCTGITFACSPKASMVKGVICDATINTLTVVSEEGDTLSFSTLDAERVVTDGILLDDTAIVYHSGKYKTGMKAQRLWLSPEEETGLAATGTNTAVSVRPATNGAKCSKIASVCSKRVSG